MPVTTTNTRVAYAGDGASVDFTVPFPFVASTDLMLLARDTAGAETPLTLAVDYTVSGGSGGTGTVTAATAPAAGVTWVILRRTAPTQDTAWVENDRFAAKSIERAVDKLTMIAQDQRGAYDARALLLPASDPVGLNALPGALARQGRMLGFDATGAPALYSPVAGTAAGVVTHRPAPEAPTPAYELYDDADAATGTVLGCYGFHGRNAAGAKTRYGAVQAAIDGATAGHEDGVLTLLCMVAGVETPAWEARGAMVGHPAGLTRTIAGHPAPGFGYHAGNRKIYAQSGIFTEEADPSELALRRADGTLDAPLPIARNAIVGWVYGQGYINDAWGGDAPYYARQGFLFFRYTDPDPTAAGGTVGVGVTKHGERVTRLRAYWAHDGRFTLLGQGAAEQNSLDDTNHTPPALLTLLCDDVAREKAVAFRAAQSPGIGFDLGMDYSSGRLRAEALSPTAATWLEVDRASADVAVGGGWGAEAARAHRVASAVNRLGLYGATTGTAVRLKAEGADAAVGLDLEGTGTGTVRLIAGGIERIAALGSGSARVLVKDTATAPGVMMRQEGDTGYGFDFDVESASVGRLDLKRVVNGTRTTVLSVVRGNGNIGLWTTSQFGGGAGVLAVANAATVPTTNPTGGGILYVQGGALMWRGSSGTVTTLAAA